MSSSSLACFSYFKVWSQKNWAADLISSHRCANLWEPQTGGCTCCISKCGPMSNKIREMQTSPSLRLKPKLPLTSQNVIFLREWQIILQQKILLCQIKRKKEALEVSDQMKEHHTKKFLSQKAQWISILQLFNSVLWKALQVTQNWSHTQFHVTHRMRKEVFSDGYKHHCHLSVDVLS